jgi:hypothetical protein
MILNLNIEPENLDGNEKPFDESENNSIGEGLDENFTKELLENEKRTKKNVNHLKKVIQKIESQSIKDGFFDGYSTDLEGKFITTPKGDIIDIQNLDIDPEKLARLKRLIELNSIKEQEAKLQTNNIENLIQSDKELNSSKEKTKNITRESANMFDSVSSTTDEQYEFLINRDTKEFQDLKETLMSDPLLKEKITQDVDYFVGPKTILDWNLFKDADVDDENSPYGFYIPDDEDVIKRLKTKVSKYSFDEENEEYENEDQSKSGDLNIRELESYDSDDDLDDDEYFDDFYDDSESGDSKKSKGWLFNNSKGEKIEDEEQSGQVDFKKFTVDLTREAMVGKLDPILGRDEEIDRLVQILSRRRKNNPVVTGEPGVGKTAVVEGLAQRIAKSEVPPNLIGSPIISLEIGSLIAGTRYRGEFEERLKFLIERIKKNPKRILFIDEIHTLIGAGSAEGTMDAANMLKPALARGGFKCIGATTMKEYKKYIEKDAALERRFQPVNIEPPNIDNSLLILSGLRSTYESFHDVKITNEALIAAVKYSDQYIRDRFLPDKAIDILDEACVSVKLKSVETSPILAKRQKQLDELLIKKDNYIRQQNYIMAAKMYDLEKKMRKIIKQLMQKKIKTQ